MICSKFPTFVVESTTPRPHRTSRYSCDLLEISYLCGRINNNALKISINNLVVICSKFPTFVVESTTPRPHRTSRYSCDLLEISYLCGRINNNALKISINNLVVICSKFPTFVVESTTIAPQKPIRNKL